MLRDHLDVIVLNQCRLGYVKGLRIENIPRPRWVLMLM